MSTFINTLLEISNISSDNAYRPTLHGVHVAVKDGEATLQASNGHAAAIRIVDLEIGDVEVFIPLDSIKTIKKLYKPRNPDVSIAAADGELRIVVDGVPFVFKDKGNFPADTLKPMYTRAPEETAEVCLDAHILSDLALALGSTKKKPLTLTMRPTGPSHPILVNVNDSAYGLIMPRRK